METFELSPDAKAHPFDSSRIGQGTVGAEIRRFAELQPEHAAAVASGFAPFSYRELQSLIDEVHAALRLAGFCRSARIAISIRNGPQAALAIVAVTCSAVSIPLNPRQTLGEIETCFAALRPDAVLLIKGADSAARRAAERASKTIIEATQSKEGTLGFSIVELTKSVAAAPNESPDLDPDAPAFILQTSGTAAQPKSIPTSHRNMIAAAARVRAWFDLTPQDRCLSVSPVFYAHGLHVTVFAPLLSGGTIAFPSDASKFDYWEWFGNLEPTWYSGAPTLHRLVLDQAKSIPDAKARHALRFVLSGGAALPQDVLEGLEQTLGVPVLEHYGSSEGMQICSNLLPPARCKPGTVGVPLPDTVCIVADDGRQLSAGERGEILVGGPTVVSGYLDVSELNHITFVDGWFKSGDIGSLDEDGFLTLHGRKDDLINRGGEKISPVEIDDALMRHPAVAEAAAFPVPHPRLGEDIAAAVVLRPNMTASPTGIRRYLQDQLASFKVPRRIIIRGQLPKGQTGKVVRRRLTESLQEDSTEEIALAPPLVENASSNAMVIQLTELWERLLKIAPLSPEDDFFEKGGDSLLAMEMLLELERLTGRTIARSILVEASTIGELAKKLSEGDGQQPNSLIKLNSKGSRAPLFYFHDDWPGYTGVKLARALGSDQPLFVVKPLGVDNEPIPGTMEAMAAVRLPLVMDAQPEGPYRLCGDCFQGIVAFEVARMLVAAGKRVELVVMLDSPTINVRKPVQLLFSIMRSARPVAGPTIERVMAWTYLKCAELQKFSNISWTRRWTAIKQRARNLAAGGGERPADQLLAKQTAILSNYFPKPLAVRIIYFSIDHGGGAWRRITSDLKVIKSPGEHNNHDFAFIAKHLRSAASGQQR